jgi:hypothetical protein
MGKHYSYNIPPICTHCGRRAEETKKISVDEMLGLVRTTVSIKIPYCSEHLALIRKFTWIKNGIYLTSFILTVVILFFLGLNQVVLSAVAGALLWAILVYPLFRYLLIKPLLRVFDKDRIFECDTNTLSFTARMDLGGLVVCFSDSAVAQQFASANSNNPRVKRVQGSVLSTVLTG